MNNNTRTDTESIIRTHSFIEANGVDVCGICLAAKSHPAHEAAEAVEHDPTGRECALAGRKADGHEVTTYCQACYEEILAGRKATPAQSRPNYGKTANYASEWLNSFVLYGGMHVRRIDVIRHLRAKGVDEHSIGFFTLKDSVELSDAMAKVADAEWARMLRIEAYEAEGMTFSDAQAAVDADELVASA